jgi:hypothetical protein
VSLPNLLIFEIIHHFKSLCLAQILNLYPNSRSTVHVTSMASLGLYFIPSALLLRLLPIQVTGQAVLLSPACILLVELRIHDLILTSHSHLFAFEILLLWSYSASRHCDIALVGIVLWVTTVACCGSRSS